MTVQIAPSILAADFANLGGEIRAMEDAGANSIHIDVMDNHFVPNLTIGADVVKKLRECSDLPFETHLMISPVELHVNTFAAAGANTISVHLEAVNVRPETGINLHRYMELFQDMDKSLQQNLEPFREAMKSWQQNLEPFREAMKSWQESMELFQKTEVSLRQNLEPFREVMKSWQESMEFFQKTEVSLRQNLEPFREAIKNWQQGLEPSRKVRESWQESMEFFQKTEVGLQQNLEPLREMEEDLQQNLEPSQETKENLRRILENIRKAGARAGVVLNPGTPLSSIESVITEVDVILVMTVKPGFGGQAFLHSELEKIKECRKRIDATEREIDLQVDGGINEETARLAVAAGANVLVAGTAAFAGGEEMYADNLAALRGEANGA